MHLARQLAETAQIVALSAGGPANSFALEMARHGGAHRVLHLDEPELDRADCLTLGTVLAEAARHIQATLVIAGERSDDEGQGMVPAALAHHLEAPLVARIQRVMPSTTTADAVVLTVRAGGRENRLEMRLPLVLSTSPAPGAPSRRDVTAKTPPVVERLTLAQLGLDPSRVIPRPSLLGARSLTPVLDIQHRSIDEVAELLLRR
jgi:electron transfer flavoprotein beta subunit